MLPFLPLSFRPFNGINVLLEPELKLIPERVTQRMVVPAEGDCLIIYTGSLRHAPRNTSDCGPRVVSIHAKVLTNQTWMLSYPAQIWFRLDQRSKASSSEGAADFLAAALGAVSFFHELSSRQIER